MKDSALSKEGRVTSILRKVAVYCDFYRENRTAEDFPAGLEEGTRQFADDGRIGFLKATSRELDVRVLELLTAEEQECLVSAYRSAGVLEADLPRTITTKRLRSLIRRGVIRTEIEYQMAQQAIVSETSKALTPDEVVALGAILDLHTAKAGHPQRESPS